MNPVVLINYKLGQLLGEVVDPHSEKAGDVAEAIADAAQACGYLDCPDPVVGCAVHPKFHERDSEFVPVCGRHKGWEFAKVQMSAGESIYL